MSRLYENCAVRALFRREKEEKEKGIRSIAHDGNGQHGRSLPVGGDRGFAVKKQGLEGQKGEYSGPIPVSRISRSRVKTERSRAMESHAR